MLRGVGDSLTWKVYWFLGSLVFGFLVCGFLASWLRGASLLVSWCLVCLFLGFKVSWFIGFKVSKIQGFISYF